MIDYISQNLWLFWTIVTILCLIMELASGDFYVTCFAIGAIVSIVAAGVGLPFWVQVVAWAVCSVLSIRLVRPRILKAMRQGGDDRKSNADALEDRIGEVSERIPQGGYGRVKIDGDDWKAQSLTANCDLERGEKVRVVGRESIILKVEKV